MWKGLIIAALIAGNITPDIEHDMQYDLPSGMSYVYRVTTDHFPFPGRGVRLHTKLIMDVLGRDENNYTACRFKLVADTINRPENGITYRPFGHIEFAGNRLYASGGYVNAMFDARGNLADDTPPDEDDSYSRQVSTQFYKFDKHLQTALSGNSPFVMQLLLPSLPDAEEVIEKKEYCDTITVPSRSVSIPTNYGVTSTVKQQVLYDTLSRTFVLDSVVTAEKRYTGYITIRTQRHNALGSRYRSITHLVRNMSTGLVNKIKEECYKYERGNEKIWYVSRAELVDRVPIKNVNDLGPGPGSP